MLHPILSAKERHRVGLNPLALFEIVLEERHVGQAAGRLNLAPSAVSHGLGRLRRLLNDPLFLRTPKGVVPTDRAMELAGPVADILARARRLSPLPRHSIRLRPRAVSQSARPTASPPCSCLRCLPNCAGSVRAFDISVRQILPPRAVRTTEGVWEPVLADIEARAMDIAVVPADEVPARFCRPNPL